MRPKLVVVVVSVSLLFLTTAFWLKEKSAGKTIAPSSVDLVAQANPKAVSVPAAPLAPAGVATRKLTPEEQSEVSAAEVDRLIQLSLKNDPASLPEILAALTHSDRDVREAAIDAVTQVGNSNSIPALKAAMETVDDPEEKIAFLEAIQFLSLPPLTFERHGTPATPEQVEAAEHRRALRRAADEAEDRKHHS